MRIVILVIFYTINLIAGFSFADEIPGTRATLGQVFRPVSSAISSTGEIPGTRVTLGFAMIYPWACAATNTATGMVWGCDQINLLYTYIEPAARVNNGAIEVTSHVFVSAMAAFYYPNPHWYQNIAIPITFSTTDSNVFFQSPTVLTQYCPESTHAEWTHGIARRKVASGAPTSQITISPYICDPSTMCFKGTLNWMPAVYQAKFTLTCYVLSLETDPMFSNSPLVSGVPGLPPNSTYFTSFLKDVQMQGSGETRDGLIIHYDGRKRYSIQKCPQTASGACAVDGQTVAVDRTIVPFKSTLGYRLNDQDQIGFGPRVAQDTGGQIKGNHIDIYFGTRRSDCKQWGTKLTGEVEIIRLN